MDLKLLMDGIVRQTTVLIAQLSTASGRLSEDAGRLRSANVVLPLGSAQGWEAAVLDHLRAVAVVIAQKVRDGVTESNLADRVGGSTFTFTVMPGHPFEDQVYALLRRTRTQVQALWDEVARHNEKSPPLMESSVRVSFYCGQAVEAADDAGSEASPIREEYDPETP